MFAGVVDHAELPPHCHVGDVFVSVLAASLTRLGSNVGRYRRGSC